MFGGGTSIHASLFQPGSTLAGRLAAEFQDPVSALHVASLFYLALVLLVIGVATNLIARTISGRFNAQVALAR